MGAQHGLQRICCRGIAGTGSWDGGPSRAQDYAPGRPNFTLAEKLQQWGHGLMGAPSQPGATSSPARIGQKGNLPANANHPNYHTYPAGSAPMSSNESAAPQGSSRRTAQQSYRPSPSTPTPDVQVDASRPRTAKSPPPSTTKPVQPRTLQEALFNSRPSREAIAETPPPASSSRPKVAATPPAPVAVPRPAPIEVPLRTARKPDVVMEPEPLEPIYEEPMPVVTTAPVQEKYKEAKPAAKPRSMEGLLFTQKSPVLAVEATGPRRTSVGRETRFKIALRNTGDVSAHDVLLVVQIPAGAEVVAAHPSVGEARLPAGQEGAPVLRWSMSEVPARSQEELDLTLLPRKNEAIELAVQWTFAPDSQQIIVDVQEPKLQLQLAGPKEVNFGEKAVYKLTFSNPGDADAENVVVTLPAVGGGDEPADSHAIGTIRAGESKTVEMELLARQMGRLTIKAEAVADSGLRTEVSEEVTVRRAGLKIELEGPKNQYARTNVNYKVLVSNTGNAAAADVQVAVQLPQRSKYISSTSGGQASGERILWTLDSLEPGQQQVLQFKCQLESGGMNRLQAAAVASDLKDLATLSTEVQAVADLALSVVEPEGAYAVGEEVMYEIRIKNRGTTAAEGINVVAYFSEGVEATAATGGRYQVSPGRITFGTISSIAADKEVVLKIKARADQPGNHVFRAEVTCAALGSKLAQEGTTRFYGSDASASSDEELEAAPTPARPSTDSARIPSSNSSRRRGSMPGEAFTPEAGTGSGSSSQSDR